MKRCPFCAEEIQDAAIVCKHCGRDLNAPEATKPAVAAALTPTPPARRSHLFGWLGLAGLFMSIFSPAFMAPLIVLIALALSALEVKQGSKVFGGILIAFCLLQVWAIADHFGGFSASFTSPKEIEQRTVRKYEAINLNVPSNAFQIITQKCAEEWPNDFNMRNHCEGRQREAISALERGQPSDITPDAFRIIRGKCAQEWPRDFTMRAHCESRQYEGYRSLQSGSVTDSVRARCAQQWPDDYQMQQHCQSRQ